jgi:hypothetical protein
MQTPWRAELVMTGNLLEYLDRNGLCFDSVQLGWRQERSSHVPDAGPPRVIIASNRE